MALDPGILLSQIQPKSFVQQVGEVERAKALKNQTMLQDMQIQQQQKALADQQKLSDLYRGNIGSDGKINRAGVLQGAADGGMGAQVPGLMKSFSEADKSAAEADYQKLKAAKAHQDAASGVLGALLQNPNLTHQDIIAGVSQLVDAGHKTPQEGAAFVRALPGDIRIARQQLLQAAMQGMSAKEQLDNQLRQAELAQGQQRIGLQQKELNLRQQQQNSGVTYQTDANGNLIALPTKTNGTTAPVGMPVVGPDGQPIGGKEKPLTDAQAKALLFGSRAKQSNDIINTVADAGELRKSDIKQTLENVPMIGGILGAGVNLTQNSREQQIEQAQRDFINAVLRRESGAVISPQEFENARRQYFPQVGDLPEAIEQKKRNRELSAQGILAEVPGNRRNELERKDSAPKTINWGDMK